MRCIGLALVIVLSGCTDECAGKGGRVVFSHYLPLFVGKGMVMVPQYRCDASV